MSSIVRIRLLTVQNVDSKLTAAGCRLEHISSHGAAIVCCTVDHASLGQPPPSRACRIVLGDIYKTASETISWLGVEAEESSLAFDLIQILSRTDDDLSRHYEEALTRLYRPSEDQEPSPHWNALWLLFSRPYWAQVSKRSCSLERSGSDAVHDTQLGNT